MRRLRLAALRRRTAFHGRIVPAPLTSSSGLVRLGAVAVLAGAAVTGCGGPDGFHGTLRAADTKGKAGTVMSGGWVAVFTPEQASEFWNRSGLSIPGAHDLGYVEGRVVHETVADSGGTLLPVDEDGTFTTTITGPRQLCVLRELPPVDLVRGCAAVDLPAEGELDIIVGEGGVRATLRD
jgi:hypothetical protein